MLNIIILGEKIGCKCSEWNRKRERNFRYNKNGYSPTVREICKLANLKSTSSVHGHIKRLKVKAHLTSGVDMPRSIALTKKEKEVKLVVNDIALMSKDGKAT